MAVAKRGKNRRVKTSHSGKQEEPLTRMFVHAHVLTTGWVSNVTYIAAILWTTLLYALPSILEGSSPSTIAWLRWTLLVFFSAVIFVVGVKTNRKKIMRKGLDGKLVLGYPNTIYFVRLQYWAFFYIILIGTAIGAWTNTEALSR